MKRLTILFSLFLSLFAVSLLLACAGPAAGAAGFSTRGVRNSQPVTATVKGINSAGSAETRVELLKPADFGKFKEAAKGKVLVVNFWATWCGPCVAEFPELVALDGKYRDQGVKLVGISADEVADIKTKVIPFVKEHKVPFDILVQDTEDIEELLTAIDKDWQGILPTTYVFDKQGVLAYTRYGIIDRDLLVAAIEKAIK